MASRTPSSSNDSVGMSTRGARAPGFFVVLIIRRRSFALSRSVIRTMLAVQPVVSIKSTHFAQAQRLRDTVNTAWPLQDCSLMVERPKELGQWGPKDLRETNATARHCRSM